MFSQQPSEELPTNAILPRFFYFLFNYIIFHISCLQEKLFKLSRELGKVSVVMETNANRKSKKAASMTAPRITKTELPLVHTNQNCDLHGYDADTLMKETANRDMLSCQLSLTNNFRC